MPKPKHDDYIKLMDVPDILRELTGVTRVRSTIYSWITKGRANYSGQMIKLKATKRLGMLYTTRAWVNDFITGVG